MNPAFGASLIEPENVYLGPERATRYGLLFVGLSFIGLLVYYVRSILQGWAGTALFAGMLSTL